MGYFIIGLADRVKGGETTGGNPWVKGGNPEAGCTQPKDEQVTESGVSFT